MTDWFEIVQWVLRGLLALYFVATAVLMLRPAGRPAVPGWLLGLMAGASLVGAVGLLLPWAPVRFAAGILLIAVLFVLSPTVFVVSKAERLEDRNPATPTTQIWARILVAALVLVAII